jgi:hypothetical protein
MRKNAPLTELCREKNFFRVPKLARKKNAKNADCDSDKDIDMEVAACAIGPLNCTR